MAAQTAATTHGRFWFGKLCQEFFSIFWTSQLSLRAELCWEGWGQDLPLLLLLHWDSLARVLEVHGHEYEAEPRKEHPAFKHEPVELQHYAVVGLTSWTKGKGTPGSSPRLWSKGTAASPCRFKSSQSF